jgi:flagellar assembly protein FliH
LSSLYKSGSVKLGTPLEIINDALPEMGCPKNAAAEEVSQGSGIPEEVSGILKEAREKAAGIINQAEENSKKAYEEARQQGYKKGYEEGEQKGLAEGFEKGRQQGLATAERMIEEAIDVKKRALETKERLVKEAEAEIIQIVLAIARKVLGEQIKTDREAVLGAVRKALEKCTFSGRVTMKVSPDDYDVIELSKKRLLAEIDGITQLDIEVEEGLSQGSCVLETESGFIDSSVEVQLSRIENTFRELLNHE